MKTLARQGFSFLTIGVAATSLHYAALVALVQVFGVRPVPAALVGFCLGGVLSYVLNRRHTFGSERPHEEAIWRFALVAGVAFLVTYVLMRMLVDGWRIPYLLAQLFTTCIVMVWTFLANRFWTFRGEA